MSIFEPTEERKEFLRLLMQGAPRAYDVLIDRITDREQWEIVGMVLANTPKEELINTIGKIQSEIVEDRDLQREETE